MSGAADIYGTTGARKNEIDEARDAIMSDDGLENAHKICSALVSTHRLILFSRHCALESDKSVRYFSRLQINHAARLNIQDAKII